MIYWMSLVENDCKYFNGDKIGPFMTLYSHMRLPKVIAMVAIL